MRVISFISICVNALAPQYTPAKAFLGVRLYVYSGRGPRLFIVPRRVHARVAKVALNVKAPFRRQNRLKYGCGGCRSDAHEAAMLAVIILGDGAASSIRVAETFRGSACSRSTTARSIAT